MSDKSMFEDMAEKFKKKEKKKCVICGVDEDTIEITSYYKLDYCPTHLAIEKKRRAKKREKNKKPSVDLSEVISRLDKQQTSMDEIKDGFKYLAKRTFLITEGTILLAIFEDPKHHALRSRLISKFSLADEKTIDDMLERMYKHDEVIDKDNTSLGTLLWKNKHGWYIVNPNIPKEVFEELTEEKIGHEQYYKFIKTQINKQRKAINREKQDEMFYQYTGVDVDTYGDRKHSHVFPVRQSVKDKIKWIEAKTAWKHRKIRVKS